MKWNKCYISTENYPYVKEKVSIFPSFDSWFRHFEKHQWNENEPWEKIIPNEDYKKNRENCHILEKIAVNVYDELAPEIEKAVHFMFLSSSACWLEDVQEADLSRIYGIDPRGFILVLSPKSVLTCFFPQSASRLEISDLYRFWKTFEFMLKKAQLSRKKAGLEKPKDFAVLEYQKFPQFYEKNRFMTFLKKYKEIKNNFREQVEKAIQNEEGCI